MIKIFFHFLLVSFLIWLIPFLASFPFFGRNGKLTVNFWVFKTTMIIVLAATTYFLFQWFYVTNLISNESFSLLVWIGIGVAIISILFDIFTVIPFNKLTLANYVAQIAWLYIIIVIISVFVGSQHI
jgi:hypothetical protein